MSKLRPESTKAVSEIRKLAGNRSRIVFVSGNFNIVHPGHLRLLRYAAECGDFLVIGVNADGTEGVIIQEHLRLEGVVSISWVNYAFILYDKPEVFIAALKPNFVVKGREHENSDNPELVSLQEYGGKLLFSSGDISFSSIDLLRNEIHQLNPSTIKHATGYLYRHKIDSAGLQDVVNRIKKLKVLVVGDLIVDEYITCEPLGMSKEDPTIVVTPVINEMYLGGAGIVAGHASALGAEVDFLSVCGNDEAADYALSRLNDIGVKSVLHRDEARPTTHKQRFRAESKTLLRVNYLRQNPISREIQSQLYEAALSRLDGKDLVIFSDFNYGVLVQNLVDKLTGLCRERDIMVVADSQSSSQIGDISRFKNMELITPTEYEARLALQNFTDGLIYLGESLRRKAMVKNILLTLGTEGLIVHASADTGSGYDTDRLPALNTAPKDVSGAGDSLLTCASLALAARVDIWMAAYLGSLASACQVGRVGNVPINTRELMQEIELIH